MYNYKMHDKMVIACQKWQLIEIGFFYFSHPKFPKNLFPSLKPKSDLGFFFPKIFFPLSKPSRHSSSLILSILTRYCRRQISLALSLNWAPPRWSNRHCHLDIIFFLQQLEEVGGRFRRIHCYGPKEVERSTFYNLEKSKGWSALWW